MTEEHLSKVLAALPQVDDAVVRCRHYLYRLPCLAWAAHLRLVLT